MTTNQDQQSTCAWLAHHARRQPTAVAITDGRDACSYRNLAANVVQFLDALTTIGIRRGQVVGVETDDRSLHLVLLLACEALGAITISLLPFEFGPAVDLGRICDRILSSQPLAGSDAAKTFVLTQEWLVQALLAPVGDDRLEALVQAPDPDSLVRLMKSSGTTGKPKVMGMTNRVQQRTIRNILHLAANDFGPHLDYLCLYGFSVRGCHSRALMALQLGGTIHLSSTSAAPDLIVAGIVNYALLVTGDLEKFVRRALLGGGGPFDIHVDVIGAAVASGLREEITQKLTRRILLTYGTNEVHHVSVVDANNVGTLLPGVRVMIVDDHGAPLPAGRTGLIRVRSDTMTDGYIGEPDLTKAAFIDGWYHTQDVGFQPSPGELVVLGRADDMLTVGGMKVAPGPVAERIKAIDGILDAMIASVVDRSGCEALLVAVEIGSDTAPPDLQSQISAVIQHYASAYQLLLLSAFPRTETGKIRHEDIREAYRLEFGLD